MISKVASKNNTVKNIYLLPNEQTFELSHINNK